MVFASTFDMGLVPFYTFATYIAYEQYNFGSYGWETLFDNGAITSQIARATFLLSVVNGGLHLVSFGISVFLGVIFYRITRLPPDMNPLEDNFTARPHKRNKSELTEKHLSTSTIGSSDPLINPPRNVPFLHTRGASPADGSSFVSSGVSSNKRQPQMLSSPNSRFSNMDTSVMSSREGTSIVHQREKPHSGTPHLHSDTRYKRRSQVPFHPDDLHAEPVRQEPRFRQWTGRPNVPISHIPTQHLDSVLAQPTSAIIQDEPISQFSSTGYDRSQCLSPASDNWVAHASRTPSPVIDEPRENTVTPEPKAMLRRSNTTASTNSGFRNWLSYSQQYGRDVGESIEESKRGEYEALAMEEYYGQDEVVRGLEQQTMGYGNGNAEQNSGARQISIYEEPEDYQDISSQRINPLALNPPTPQPSLDNALESPDTRRVALTDIPNLSPSPRPKTPAVDGQKKGRFYGEIEGNPSLSVPRGISGVDEAYTRESGKTKSKIFKRLSQKINPYNTLNQYDDNDDTDDHIASRDLAPNDGDRQGRVVSNSGADLDFQRSQGLGSSWSYGNYIAGLGVGRRRDVSGKAAEEGRGDSLQTASEKTTPIRAAGWARFSGL